MSKIERRDLIKQNPQDGMYLCLHPLCYKADGLALANPGDCYYRGERARSLCYQRSPGWEISIRLAHLSSPFCKVLFHSYY